MPNKKLFLVIKATSLGLIFVVLFGAAVSVTAQQRLPQDVVFLIDNSPSARTGEGAPDGLPTDPQNLRLRMARFSIGVLGVIPETTDQRVGVVGFSRDLDIMAPLTPVDDWTKADLAGITDADIGTGTDFAKALQTARDMLITPDEAPCTENTRSCDIILISDGIFDAPVTERQAVAQTLQTLSDGGISVHVLVFAEADSASQEIWQTLLDEGLIDRYENGVTQAFSEAPQEVYGLLFDILNVRNFFNAYEPLVTPGAITREVAPYRQRVQWSLIPDSSMTPVFMLNGKRQEPLRAGTEYFFLEEPLSGLWEVTFDAPGLVYVRQTDVENSVTLNVRSIPISVQEGQPVPLAVNLVAGAGTPVMQTELFIVTARISGPLTTTIVPMQRDKEYFTSILSTAGFVTGTYTAEFSVTESPPGIDVAPVTSAFDILPLPTPPHVILPTFSIAPSGPISPGNAITVTVDYCPDEYALTLLLINAEFTTAIPISCTVSGPLPVSTALTQTTALMLELAPEGMRTEAQIAPVSVPVPICPPIICPDYPRVNYLLWILIGFMPGGIAGLLLMYAMYPGKSRNSELANTISMLTGENDSLKEELVEKEFELQNTQEKLRKLQNEISNSQEKDRRELVNMTFNVWKETDEGFEIDNKEFLTQIAQLLLNKSRHEETREVNDDYVREIYDLFKEQFRGDNQI